MEIDKTIRATTNVNTVKLKFVWKLNNFSLLDHETGQAMLSPIFHASDEKNIKWKLNLYPRGYNLECKDFISLYFELETFNDSRNAIAVDQKVGISNNQNQICLESNDQLVYKKDLRSWGYNKFLNKKTLMTNPSFMPNDCLTIVCNIAYSINITNSIHSDNCHLHSEESQHKSLNRFETIFENQEFCDITLIVSGQKIGAHKAILAGYSPVFFAMFKSDMKEKKQNEINITDIEYKILKELLRFIYCQKIENIEPIVNDLLAAADKYEIVNLKLKCEQYLCNNINVDNVIDMISIADTYNASTLEKCAIKFFVAHKKNVNNSLEFSNLQPSAMSKIIQALTSV